MAVASSKSPGGVDPVMMQALLSLASGPSASAGGGVVYMGSERYTKGGMDKGSGGQLPRGKTMYGTKDITMTEEEATKDFFYWSAKKQGDFISKGILAGRLPLGAGLQEGAADWKKLVSLAAQFGSAGKKVTPWDILATYVGASGGGNAWTQQGVWEINTQTGQRRYKGPGKYLGNGQALETSSRVDLTDPDTAKAVATKLFQDMMGRDPGAGELGNFASALHSAEQNSPVVANTTTTYDMDTGQALSSSTASSGGVSAEGKAYLGEQQVKKKKEYGAFQAATTYQNALESLVFGAPE
jgi:hypothetical protein